MGLLDEAFFTGTAVEVNGIGKIDGIVFNKGKEGQTTKHLRETYAQIVAGELPPLHKVAEGNKIDLSIYSQNLFPPRKA